MKMFVVLLLVLGCISAAQADVWKWVDAKGNVHFVDTMKTIYTWVDERGDVHYSDAPDHEDAVAVQLVWVSSGSLTDVNGVANDTTDDSGGWSDPGETEAQRAERERAEAYYCKRATEIYESYVNAPRLYKTGDDGERVFLQWSAPLHLCPDTRVHRRRLSCRGAVH